MPVVPNATGLDPAYFLEGSPATSPTATLKQTLPLLFATGNTAALTTQVMTSAAIFLEPGDVATNLTFLSGGTAAGTPTNWWFALYSPAGTLISQTADQTSTAWGANTAQTKALQTPYTVLAPGVFYVAVMVKATTPPTLAGITLENAAAAGNVGSLGFKVLAQTSGSALTATAPGTIASPTTVATVPWCAVS